ncbi:NAD(P)-binding protein [Bimuria novae-zelandiae CBS 107.79]|uniref:NAD(P)-binding protein n=1 Tax=Bimuria novae-zelandiae CBS 107.79 TaxID=1447943 RepID=A0A6A5VG33_9PLEO|nr:NAD(P)-binding protein [Bimuria novae-zelandiae CBS 107.79]
MVYVQFNSDLLSTLNGKAVVLTGGATGIGRSAVIQFVNAGCKVVFGDVNDVAARELESSLGESVRFQHCDTSSYQAQLGLFALAESTYGRVDIVVANAGVANHKDIFDPSSDILVEPSMMEVDINLKGSIFTARIGMHYLRKTGGGDLVLVSSIAGFKECGGLAPYTASKHGVLGLMRGLHIVAIPENIRINVICPWMTKTRLVKGIEAGWRELGLPENEPEDVARSIVLCASANRSKDGKTHPGARMPFAGKILWIAGGESYEIEDAIQELEPKWLGEENSRVLAKGQEFLASQGTSWDADKLGQKTP